MNHATAVAAGLFMFLAGFVLGGLFILPHVPPTPREPVSMFEWRFWIDNWPGAILGVALGAFSYRASVKRPRNAPE